MYSVLGGYDQVLRQVQYGLGYRSGLGPAYRIWVEVARNPTKILEAKHQSTCSLETEPTQENQKKLEKKTHRGVENVVHHLNKS